MKMRVLLVAALLSVLSFGSAKAESVNLLTLNPDDYGKFMVTSGADGVLQSEALGLLATNSKIVFSYHVPGSVLPGVNVASSLGYTAASLDHFVQATTLGGLVSNSDGLVMASANLDNATLSGETSITNLSRTAISFKSLFFSYFRPFSTALVSYRVAAVPLPAALPLFGAALVGVAALRRRKAKA